MTFSKRLVALLGLCFGWPQIPAALAQTADWTKPDWASTDAPASPAAIVAIPEFPQANRRFAIQRSGAHSGPGNILRIANQTGRLEILNGDNLVLSINLGRCFSFARMDEQHDFARQGNPQYATAPTDCRVWDGRRWTQTYRTQTSTYRNPCYYQPGYTARVAAGSNGRLVETTGAGPGIVWDNQRTFQVRTAVIYDEPLGFFRMFDVGYIGKVDILNEIK
jgi:hypothetical protein